MLLASPTVLIPFNLKLPIVVACDASSYGIGGVPAHITPEGLERPIMYASVVLNKTETRYSQLEKEALSIMYCVKKFHNYLYGQRFTLHTDYKPLQTLLFPKENLPSLAAARIQR